MSVKTAWRTLMNRPYIKITGNGDEYLWIDRGEAENLIRQLGELLQIPPGHEADNGTDGHRMRGNQPWSATLR